MVQPGFVAIRFGCRSTGTDRASEQGRFCHICHPGRPDCLVAWAPAEECPTYQIVAKKNRDWKVLASHLGRTQERFAIAVSIAESAIAIDRTALVVVFEFANWNSCLAQVASRIPVLLRLAEHFSGDERTAKRDPDRAAAARERVARTGVVERALVAFPGQKLKVARRWQPALRQQNPWRNIPRVAIARA